MGKSKRNCRRTEDEVLIHEKAVKMRKMTDEQLVHYVEDRVAKADSEGFNRGKASARKGTGVKEFIQYLDLILKSCFVFHENTSLANVDYNRNTATLFFFLRIA